MCRGPRCRWTRAWFCAKALGQSATERCKSAQHGKRPVVCCDGFSQLCIWVGCGVPGVGFFCVVLCRDGLFQLYIWVGFNHDRRQGSVHGAIPTKFVRDHRTVQLSALLLRHDGMSSALLMPNGMFTEIMYCLNVRLPESADCLLMSRPLPSMLCFQEPMPLTTTLLGASADSDGSSMACRLGKPAAGALHAVLYVLEVFEQVAGLAERWLVGFQSWGGASFLFLVPLPAKRAGCGVLLASSLPQNSPMLMV